MIGGVRGFVLRLAMIAVVIGVWEVAVRTLDVPAYILPTPSSIFAALVRGIVGGLYVDHLWTTLLETLLGFLTGSVLAFLFGTVIAMSRRVEYFLYPFIVMFQSMPKVALAPLIVVWFGLGIA